MPLQLEQLDDLKEYIDAYPGIPLFFRIGEGTKKREFVIIAGKGAWRGVVEEGDALEKWLTDHGGKRVKGYRELRELFG